MNSTLCMAFVVLAVLLVVLYAGISPNSLNAGVVYGGF